MRVDEARDHAAAGRVDLRGALLLTVACFAVAIRLPAAGFYENQEAFRTVLGTTPQLVLAGLAGYFVGQLLNSVTLVLIKERTKEKHLWARLVGSTFVGQLGDTVVFCAIAAGVIGPVREVHVWTDRPQRYWAQGIPRPEAPTVAAAVPPAAQAPAPGKPGNLAGRAPGDAAAMEALETRILARLGIADPYAGTIVTVEEGP